MSEFDDSPETEAIREEMTEAWRDGNVIEIATGRITALRAENDRLREQVAGLTAALEPFARYADELLWGDRGVRDDVVLRWPYYGPPRVIVRRRDFKALRAALPVSNPGLSISPVVPNPGLPISPAPPTEGGESS